LEEDEEEEAVEDSSLKLGGSMERMDFIL